MFKNIAVGSIIDGKVVKIKPFGAIVDIGEGVCGLVHISQISEKFVQDINDVVSIDQEVSVKVLDVDEANRKINLSIKEALKENKISPQSTESTNKNYNRKSYEKQQEDSSRSKPSFDDMLKEWTKQANERQAGINKRNNRR